MHGNGRIGAVTRRAALLGTAGLGLSGPALAQAETWPDRPVRIVVPVPPGGIVDVVIRLVGREMASRTGQGMVIDNRPGASTNVGSEFVARSRGDGYTLLTNSLPLVVNPALIGPAGFDVRTDLRPVSLIAAIPLVLVVHPSVPAASVADLLALARARPGALTYSSGGNGTNQHVAAELMKSLAGVDILHVPYRGGGPAQVALISGEVNASLLSAVAVLPMLGTGQLRALAVTGAERLALLPDVPTLAEAGVPGYEFTSWVGILAPGSTPPALVQRINRAVVEATRAPAVSDRLVADGAQVVASTPEVFAAQIDTELGRWARLVRETGMKPD
ncbi:tripartite tricarboxylate transporter substrate binding protein [Falsiroseomonas sp. CW058]|uniref:tripartite tricarboxylate transporter substrate binding protein n=1 Tax=Falsiroseomonas sp. CW058 TaxID=3388664 RepID=UPI003D317883